MDLVQLAYASRCTSSISEETLADIRRSAMAHNSTQEITGALCYAFGRFIQVLEGPSLPVNKLYLKIAADTRHDQVQLLGFQAIDKRLFSMWSMKVIQLDERSSKEVQTFVEHNQFGAFKPGTWSLDKTAKFMHKLAQITPEK